MEEDNIIVATVMHLVQHYNPKKYWKMRSIVIDPNNKTPKLLKLWYFFRIKRMDAYNNASMGTSIGSGAIFKTPPVLWHGLNGIVVSHYAEIGENCIINQQVTIGGGEL